MRISVIGAGAVGGALAALLHGAGHEIAVVARGATAVAIAADGLRLRGHRGSRTVRPDVVHSPAPGSELVVVAVRTYQLDGAIAPHRAAIGAAPVLVAQNGLNGPDRAATLLGRERGRGVLGGLALFPATNAGAGEVLLTGPGGLRIGAAHPADLPLARRIAGEFAAALPTAATANLTGALWMKLLVNHVNALPAITGTSVQATSRHPLLRGALAESLAESVRVADALGVRFEGVGVLHPHHAAAIRAGRADEVVGSRLAHAFGVRPNPASTLQSLRRGQPTEIDDLNGAVVRAAARLRLPAPVNTRLVALVHEVERRGRFFRAAATAERLAR